MRHENAGSIPDEEFLKAALDARHYLEDLFQKDCLGFAWPCGRYTESTADALLKAGFAYGRTTQYSEQVGIGTHPMMLQSSCHFQDNSFHERFEQARKANRIFYFWGHSYEMLDSEGMWRQFEDKIQFLCDDKEVEWCNVSDIDWLARSRM
jgi:hypothetical protein